MSSISIGADGTVSVTQPGQQAAQQVGSIQLALFPNPGGLNSVGKNLFLATTASGDPNPAHQNGGIKPPGTWAAAGANSPPLKFGFTLAD